jgi:hypothetical protein
LGIDLVRSDFLGTLDMLVLPLSRYEFVYTIPRVTKHS